MFRCAQHDSFTEVSLIKVIGIMLVDEKRDEFFEVDADPHGYKSGLFQYWNDQAFPESRADQRRPLINESQKNDTTYEA